MSQAVSSMTLADALEAEGFSFPKECREVRLIAAVNSALMIQYDVFLTPDDLIRVGKALQRIGKDNE